MNAPTLPAKITPDEIVDRASEEIARKGFAYFSPLIAIEDRHGSQVAAFSFVGHGDSRCVEIATDQPATASLSAKPEAEVEVVISVGEV